MLVICRISRVSMRRNVAPGAPRRSKPKEGTAIAYLPSSTSAAARIVAASTVPWPPLPWSLTSYIDSALLALARSSKLMALPARLHRWTNRPGPAIRQPWQREALVEGRTDHNRELEQPARQRCEQSRDRQTAPG